MFEKCLREQWLNDSPDGKVSLRGRSSGGGLVEGRKTFIVGVDEENEPLYLYRVHNSKIVECHV